MQFVSERKQIALRAGGKPFERNALRLFAINRSERRIKMVVKIIGLVIGILIAAFGGYYFSKEKDDAESRKIYGIAMAVGVIIAVACVIFLIV